MASSSATKAPKPRVNKPLSIRIWEHRYIYLFLIPAFALCFIFAYVPMYGVLLAFKDFKFNLGILASPWIGFKHFKKFLVSTEFWMAVKNTVVISVLKLVINFPAPIILALLLNELRSLKYKRVVQTVSYLPHFVSWVVVLTIMTAIFSPYGGIINSIRKSMGLEAVFYLGEKKYFYAFIVLTDMWKGVGWGTIIFLSAISSISPELYEAAICDGAGRLKCVWHITIASIIPTIGIMFIFAAGGVLSVNFEQVLLFQQPSNLEISQVLDTYVLNKGIGQGQFAFATAVGLFKSLLSFIIMYCVNMISRKTMEVSMW